MAMHDQPADTGGFLTLFDASPADEVHTAPAALTAFLSGLGALLAAPFSLTFSITAVLGALGVLTAFVGVVRTSRRHVAGRALAPLGLLFSVLALGSLGLRFAGIDTAYGDAMLPSLEGTLEWLNAVLGAPQTLRP